MAATRPTTDDHGETAHTTLAEQITEIDTEYDCRDCRQPDCHGTLTTTDDNRVVCDSCRCTPDGIYLPPETDERFVDTAHIEGTFIQSSWFKPHPSRVESTHLDSPDRYYNSGRVILPGGNEDVYDEDDEIRPDGITDEYTFDLTP